MNVAYDISRWVAAPCNLQSVGGADRPLSAFMAALASWVEGAPLAGLMRGAAPEQVEAWAAHVLAESSVPQARAQLWVRGLLGETWGKPTVTSADGTALDPYQVEAIAKTPVSGGVWNIDMGLGKTLTAVCAALDAVSVGRCSKARCWIICPLNAMGAWTPYLTDLRAAFDDVRILSVDSAHKFTAIPPDGGFLILDEAHTLKSWTPRRKANGDRSPASGRAMAAVKIRQQFDIALCLTGTLLHAGAVSVLPIADIATPGFAAFGTTWQFAEFFGCLEKKRLGSRTVTAVDQPTGEDYSRFLDWISRFTLSINTESESVKETLTIPPQAVEALPVGQPWPPVHEQAAALALAMMEDSVEGEIPHASAVMHAMLRADMPAKWEAWLAECETRNLLAEPWVFFAHYKDSLNWLDAKLTESGVSFVRVDGDTTQAERVEAVRRFQAGEVAAFLGQTTAAGISTNLVRAAHSCMWDATHKAIDYAQALRRTRRRGQVRPCLHLDLCSNALQFAAIERVRAGRDFNAAHASWVEAKAKLALLTPGRSTV